MPEHASEKARRLGHEPTDLDPARILTIAAILVVTVVAGSVGAYWLAKFTTGAHRELPHGSLSEPQGPAIPGPNLQRDPPGDLRRFEEHKRNWLHGYGWVDKKSGVVHIPIQRAMALMGRDETPSLPQADSPASGGSQ